MNNPAVPPVVSELEDESSSSFSGVVSGALSAAG
jgi:hypothetical protein